MRPILPVMPEPSDAPLVARAAFLGTGQPTLLIGDLGVYGDFFAPRFHRKSVVLHHMAIEFHNSGLNYGFQIG